MIERMVIVIKANLKPTILICSENNEMQDSNVHIRTFPPFNLLFYWMLISFVDTNPQIDWIIKERVKTNNRLFMT